MKTRTFACCLLALILHATPTMTKQQPVPRVFSAPTGIIFSPIRPDRTGDFEAVMRRTFELLRSATDEQLRKMGEGWKMFRSVEPGPNGSVLYIWLVDPVVPGADYSVTQILTKLAPEEVQPLYSRYSQAFAGGQSMVNLMPPGAAPGSVPAQPIASGPSGSGRVLGSWSGGGAKETESFNVSTTEWRISWTVSGEGFFAVSVYNDAAELVSTAGNTNGPASDSSYVRGRPGRYYLKVSAANVQWSLRAEEVMR